MGVLRTVNTKEESWKPIICGPCHPSIKICQKKVLVPVEDVYEEEDFFRPPTPVPELKWIKPKCPERHLPPKCPDYSFVCKANNGPEGVAYQNEKGPLISSKKETLPGDPAPEDVRIDESMEEKGEEVKEPETAKNEEVKDQVADSFIDDIKEFIEEVKSDVEDFIDDVINDDKDESKDPEKVANNQEAIEPEDSQVISDIKEAETKEVTNNKPGAVLVRSTEKEGKDEHTPKMLATTATKGSKSNKEVVSTPRATAQTEYLDDYQYEEKINEKQDVVQGDLKPEIDIELELVANDVKEFMEEVANEVEDFVGGVMNDVQRFKEGLRLDVDRFFNSVEKNRFERRKRSAAKEVSLPNPVLEEKIEDITANVKEGVMSEFSALLRNLVGF